MAFHRETVLVGVCVVPPCQYSLYPKSFICRRRESVYLGGGGVGASVGGGRGA